MVAGSPLRTAAFISSMLLTAFVCPNGQAAENLYVEDFTTTVYRDAAYTTAVWDTVTGELRLPEFAAELLVTEDTLGSAWDIAMMGNLAFVADWTNGLVVVDFSSGYSPTLVATLSTPGETSQVEIVGQRAYVADGVGGLRIVDVSDPTTPVELGAIVTPGRAWGVAVLGTLAFVADQGAGLQVIDVADPSLPVIIGTADTPGNAISVAVAGDLAFVADRGAGLTIVDVSDPVNPAVIGGYDTAADTWGIAVEGTVAYLGDAGGGLHVVDVSDPGLPVLITNFDPGGSWRRLQVVGDRLYAAAYGAVMVIDVTDPSSPVLLETLDTPGIATAVEFRGRRLYVADGSEGVHMYNAADDSIDRLVAVTDLSGDEIDAAVRGDEAFVLCSSHELHALDMSDPEQPSLLSTFDPGLPIGTGYDLELLGRLAYVAYGQGGLRIFDVTDPAAIAAVGWYSQTDVNSAVVGAGVAFVGRGAAIDVVDVSSPAAPSLITTIPLGVVPRGLVLDGHLLYAVNAATGLHIYDVGDPGSPAAVGSFDTPGTALEVEVEGTRAFLADTVSGLVQLDVSNPALPVQTSAYPAGAGPISGIEVSGDVALALFGIRLYELSVFKASSFTVRSITDLGVSGPLLLVDHQGDHSFGVGSAAGVLTIRSYMRDVSLSANEGRSLDIRGLQRPVILARLTTQETGWVDWRFLGGAQPWLSVVPGEWVSVDSGENPLTWSARLWFEAPVLPTVSNLQIEMLYDVPCIESITDVGNDQGGQVRVVWARSGFDHSTSSNPILDYTILRRIDPGPETAARAEPGWDYVGTVPARGDDHYSTVVPTLIDSTVVYGQHLTTFVVSAQSSVPGLYFDSPEASGYSVDNLVPLPPANLVVQYGGGSGNHLVWEGDPADESVRYRVYRGPGSDVVAGPETLVATTTTASWTDPEFSSSTVAYRVSAVDPSGNESGAVAPARSTAAGPAPNTHRADIVAMVPNPFNPSTKITYSVPDGGEVVRLDVYDIAGRRVRTLLHEPVEGGRHDVVWDGRDARGDRVASGAYFCRLQAGTVTVTRKMVLVK